MRLDLFALIGRADGSRIERPRRADLTRFEQDCFFRPLPPKRDDEAALKLAQAC